VTGFWRWAVLASSLILVTPAALAQAPTAPGGRQPVVPTTPPSFTPPASGQDGCTGLLVNVGANLGASAARCLQAKDRFRDCDAGCPEMVVIPAGSFNMGTPTSEASHDDDEAPLHKVTFAAPFAVGRTSVTRGDYLAYVADSGAKLSTKCTTLSAGGKPVDGPSGTSTRDPGFKQDDGHPAVCVSFNDAKAYVAWLNKKTGRTYRLLTEAEREYVTRAGTSTAFWFGPGISPTQANYDGTVDPYAGGGSKGVYRKQTVAGDMFQPNAFGVYNVHGNVYEWVEDCYHSNYTGAPSNGTAWTSGGCGGDRVVRGGSWYGIPEHLRSGVRFLFSEDARGNNLGFRVARVLTP